jgi:hypothetical protein
VVAKNNWRILLLISLLLVVAIELLFFAWLFTLPQTKAVVGGLDQFSLNDKPDIAAAATHLDADSSEQSAKQSIPSLPIADDFTQVSTPDFDALDIKEDRPQAPVAPKSTANALRGGETSWDIKWPALPLINAPSELTQQSRSESEPLKNGLRVDQKSNEGASGNVAPERPLAGMATRELLQKWCEAERADIFPFEGELAQRGFGRISKDLAQHYLSDDSQQRQRLVDEVLKRPGVDARPWLLLLADDTDAEVRLASVTVMATSTDLALIEKAWQVAIRDRDPRIAGLAGRLRERHSKTLSR